MVRVVLSVRYGGGADYLATAIDAICVTPWATKPDIDIRPVAIKKSIGRATRTGCANNLATIVDVAHVHKTVIGNEAVHCPAAVKKSQLRKRAVCVAVANNLATIIDATSS